MLLCLRVGNNSIDERVMTSRIEVVEYTVTALLSSPRLKKREEVGGW